tara:strand:+ start:2116 stop:2790 length:675 start_codon:yes stop_codon:yes gene_type:complete
MSSPDLASKINTWIFDLDNTLYQTTPKMLAQIDDLMGSFISDFLAVNRAEARRIQKQYFKTHGLTLRGLMVEHSLDPEKYIKHLSRLDLSSVKKNPKLAEMLELLPGQKIIHTNAFTQHTEEVMDRIGITKYFDAVFDIVDANFIPKPALDPYIQLCDMYNINPARAVMVEDIARNLKPAADLGMTTVWVQTNINWGRNPVEDNYIDYQTNNLMTWLENIVSSQ